MFQTFYTTLNTDPFKFLNQLEFLSNQIYGFETCEKMCCEIFQILKGKKHSTILFNIICLAKVVLFHWNDNETLKHFFSLWIFRSNFTFKLSLFKTIIQGISDDTFVFASIVLYSIQLHPTFKTSFLQDRSKEQRNDLFNWKILVPKVINNL